MFESYVNFWHSPQKQSYLNVYCSIVVHVISLSCVHAHSIMLRRVQYISGKCSYRFVCGTGMAGPRLLPAIGSAKSSRDSSKRSVPPYQPNLTSKYETLYCNRCICSFVLHNKDAGCLHHQQAEIHCVDLIT